MIAPVGGGAAYATTGENPAHIKVHTTGIATPFTVDTLLVATVQITSTVLPTSPTISDNTVGGGAWKPLSTGFVTNPTSPHAPMASWYKVVNAADAANATLTVTFAWTLPTVDLTAVSLIVGAWHGFTGKPTLDPSLSLASNHAADNSPATSLTIPLGLSAAGRVKNELIVVFSGITTGDFGGTHFTNNGNTAYPNPTTIVGPVGGHTSLAWCVSTTKPAATSTVNFTGITPHQGLAGIAGVFYGGTTPTAIAPHGVASVRPTAPFSGTTLTTPAITPGLSVGDLVICCLVLTQAHGLTPQPATIHDSASGGAAWIPLTGTPVINGATYAGSRTTWWKIANAADAATPAFTATVGWTGAAATTFPPTLILASYGGFGKPPVRTGSFPFGFGAAPPAAQHVSLNPTPSPGKTAVELLIVVGAPVGGVVTGQSISVATAPHVGPVTAQVANPGCFFGYAMTTVAPTNTTELFYDYTATGATPQATFLAATLFRAGTLTPTLMIGTTLDIQASLNVLAGTHTLDAQAAANVWAGTHTFDLVAALNIKAGTHTLDINAVCNVLDGTHTFDAQKALTRLAHGI